MCDEKYMQYAIDIAKNGTGYVNPNPLVGAVIVKDGKIIGKGYHKKFGDWHAEINAINSCKEDIKGADMYVTLEPCCHYGKTPPCTDAIIKSGIKRVIIGCLDQNPIVNSKGVEILKNNNIEVSVGILEDKCKELNKMFFYYIKNKIPYITIKYAMTIDGKIATVKNDSKWITGESSRLNVHKTRSEFMSIMAGIGTVLKDNPMLNCRIENTSNPIRIICDSKLRIPVDCNIINTSKDIKTYIATTKDENDDRVKFIKDKGANIITVPEKDGHLDIECLINIIGKLGINSILVEGGSEINFSILKTGLVNEIQCYIAPKIFGGNAKTPVGGKGVEFISECFNFKLSDMKTIEDDVLLKYERR